MGTVPAHSSALLLFNVLQVGRPGHHPKCSSGAVCDANSSAAGGLQRLVMGLVFHLEC